MLRATHAAVESHAALVLGSKRRAQQLAVSSLLCECLWVGSGGLVIGSSNGRLIKDLERGWPTGRP
jgi:hypothetical protein